MTEGISHIEEVDIDRIAQTVFGPSAEVCSVVEIRQSEGELPRIIGCNWNLSYIVSIVGHDGKYVFRFNRQRFGRDDASILNEEMNNALIAARTQIPVPHIHHVDVSRTVVPTGYMVMDYLIGDDWRYLAHQQHPTTSNSDKQEIARLLGQATAEIHPKTFKSRFCVGKFTTQNVFKIDFWH